MEEFRTSPRLARTATADSLAAVGAWRAPEPRRPPSQPANDWRVERVDLARDDEEPFRMPVWLVVGAGAVCAAVLGMMLGGAMAI